MSDVVNIPARHAKAAFVSKGQRIKVINSKRPRNAHFQVLG